MRGKILKLAKRLNKFTLDEIEPILLADDTEWKPILEELVSEKILNFLNGTYFYIKKQSQKSDLPMFFQFHTKEEIDMIIKCFCAGLTSTKSALILEPSEDVINEFNKYFRQTLYQKQEKELINYFDKNPKIACVRTFYDVSVFLYFYKSKLFVSKKILKSENLTKHTKNEMLQIKIIYSRLKRSINHSTMKKFMPHHGAEHIWRYGKEFEQLKYELYQNLNL